MLALWLVVAAQVDMVPTLKKGPVVLIEEGKDGTFGQATAMVLVDAAPDDVWAMLLKVDDFKTFMPKVLTSEVTRRGPKDFDAHFVIDVPGPDTDYTVRYTPNAVARTLDGTWLSGDLKASRWHWQVDPGPNGTSLVSHTMAVRNFSGLAQKFEDDAQTITVGVNVSSVLVATKALKRRCEKALLPADAGK